MRKTVSINDQRNGITNTVLRSVGFTFNLMAVMVSSFATFFTRPVPIERPLILLLGSFLCLFNFKKLWSLVLLQKIILLYLICILFNQLLLLFVRIPLGQTCLTFPASFWALILLLAGFVLIKAAKIDSPITARERDLFIGWAACFGLIVSHMMLLIMMLSKFYGYGYGHNLKVIKSLYLYFSVFIFSWSQLDSVHFRQITAAVFAALYICLIIVKG